MRGTHKQQSGLCKMSWYPAWVHPDPADIISASDTQTAETTAMRMSLNGIRIMKVTLKTKPLENLSGYKPNQTQ